MASKTKRITLSDDKVIDISLLPLRSYGDLLVAVQSVFKEIIDEWESASEDEIVAKIPEFVSKHMDEAGKIIEIGTRRQVTAEEALDQRGLADAIVIFTAILEVNDIQGMVTTIKKAMAGYKMAKQAATTPTDQPTTAPQTSN